MRIGYGGRTVAVMERVRLRIFTRHGNLSKLGKKSQFYDITHAILHFPIKASRIYHLGDFRRSYNAILCKFALQNIRLASASLLPQRFHVHQSCRNHSRQHQMVRPSSTSPVDLMKSDLPLGLLFFHATELTFRDRTKWTTTAVSNSFYGWTTTTNHCRLPATTFTTWPLYSL
jgi:hypothetical protein